MLSSVDVPLVHLKLDITSKYSPEIKRSPSSRWYQDGTEDVVGARRPLPSFGATRTLLFR